jgi:hypothetical protein
MLGADRAPERSGDRLGFGREVKLITRDRDFLAFSEAAGLDLAL